MMYVVERGRERGVNLSHELGPMEDFLKSARTTLKGLYSYLVSLLMTCYDKGRR